MKDTLLRFVKYFLLFAAFLLAVLLVFGIVLLLDWPWWVGFFVLLALAALGVGALFIRKLLARRKEQSFVQQVIAQDEAGIAALSAKEKDEAKELQERFRQAVEMLKRSHLKKRGNPLYVLPWYMVIGESGSGKTTAIGSARLTSSFTEMARTQGVSGTKNCDWWFFEQAILLDTAGRYAMPVDEGRDKDEWQKFLTLLAKYRRREPIHGLIVTVSADKLLQAPPEALEEDGRNIRRRTDELMRVLGAKFPVYVLVTKCDLVQGMTRFCDQLPERSLDQPMGVLNADFAGDAAAFLERAMQTVGERLRSLRILLLNKKEAGDVDPGLLLFPDEFDQLKRGLEPFMKAAFQPSPYQETPILRGLFFSSGRQEGSPFSHFLSALGLISEKEVLPGTNRGLFLHDFFARVLPGDKKLFAPTHRAIEWQALTRNLGLACWVLLGIAVCGIMSFAFVKNLRTIREASHEFIGMPTAQVEAAGLPGLERFAQSIRGVEKRNRSWWIPRFGLNESLNVENGLKEKYCARFQGGYLVPFDRRMGEAMAVLTPSTQDETVGVYAAHLVRRINLLKAKNDGKGIEALRAMPQPVYVPFGEAEDSPTVAAARESFGRLYFDYLSWRANEGETAKEISVLQAWLRTLLAVKGSNVRWLAAWVDRQGTVPRVNMKDFWGGGPPQQGEVFVPPSFTLKGKETIDAAVAEVGQALSSPQALAGQKAEFDRWHRAASLEAWQAFRAAFPKGSARLRTREEAQQAAARMATDQGPYFALLERMAKELEGYSGDPAAPGWVRLLFQFQAAKGRGAGVAAKTADEGKKLLSKLGDRLGAEAEKAVDAKLGAPKAWQDYQAALTAIAPVSTSPNQALQMVSQAYGEDPAVGKSPFFAARNAAGKLRAALGEGADEPFWSLVNGPLSFLVSYAQWDAAQAIQAQWEQTVLAEAQGGSAAAAQNLLGPDGPVWKFAKGPVAPFLGWSIQKGYFGRELLGSSFPFEPSFLSFLKQSSATKQSAAKPSYAVTIRGLPTDTNADARVKPQSTKIELQCATGNQSLVNYHYPIGKTFQWSPDACADVTFQIELAGGVLLTRKYIGNQAFPEFLQDFRGGVRSFSPGEFPGEKGALDRMGIKFIRVNYLFGGDVASVGQMKALSGQLPKRIARGFGQ